MSVHQEGEGFLGQFLVDLTALSADTRKRLATMSEMDQVARSNTHGPQGMRSG